MTCRRKLSIRQLLLDKMLRRRSASFCQMAVMWMDPGWVVLLDDTSHLPLILSLFMQISEMCGNSDLVQDDDDLSSTNQDLNEACLRHFSKLHRFLPALRHIYKIYFFAGELYDETHRLKVLCETYLSARQLCLTVRTLICLSQRHRLLICSSLVLLERFHLKIPLRNYIKQYRGWNKTYGQ